MSSDPAPSGALDRIDGENFAAWYDEHTFAQNVRKGVHFFNGPASVPEPARHAPSQLLQCHRKTSYRQQNAPAERTPPEGIFWIGRRFEEDIVVPYLRDIVGEGEYVRSSMWIDETISTETGELRFKGSTDPVIVDAEGRPLVVTEVKTKRSIEGLERPNRHHRAQVHAYMYGLDAATDRTVEDAVLIYGDRETLAVRVFHERFDPAFWEQVVDWARAHTTFREAEELPPAEPEYDWECGVCAYANRCGQTDLPFEDVGINGFLPSFDDYPREQAVEYLEAHEGAKLTPSLAHRYPVLAEDHGAYDWSCSTCGDSLAWEDAEPTDGANDPLCPTCADGEALGQLTEPSPTEQ